MDSNRARDFAFLRSSYLWESRRWRSLRTTNEPQNASAETADTKQEPCQQSKVIPETRTRDSSRESELTVNAQQAEFLGYRRTIRCVATEHRRSSRSDSTSEGNGVEDADNRFGTFITYRRGRFGVLRSGFVADCCRRGVRRDTLGVRIKRDEIESSPNIVDGVAYFCAQPGYTLSTPIRERESGDTMSKRVLWGPHQPSPTGRSTSGTRTTLCTP